MVYHKLCGTKNANNGINDHEFARIIRIHPDGNAPTEQQILAQGRAKRDPGLTDTPLVCALKAQKNPYRATPQIIMMKMEMGTVRRMHNLGPALREA